MASPGKTIRTPKKGSPAKSSLLRDDSLEVVFAAFLKKRRGEASLGVFASELGIPKGTLARYENSEQSITLQMLQRIMRALNVSIADVFGKSVKHPFRQITRT